MTSICIDGFNLALPKGTGIATYGRNLLDSARTAGFGTQVLYGPTARRRDEAPISVPVAVTVLGSEQLRTLAADSLQDLRAVTPGIAVGEVSGGVGGTVSLRGVGTTAGSNPTFEQTVAVNIDGVQLSRGGAVRVGQIDMEKIEVLRGPQALFFGKNSPAGVISITTADPGRSFEV